MLFPTVTFALFFLIVLPLNWLFMPRQAWWRVFILAASYVFYGWWNWRYVFLLVGLTLFNWFFGRFIHGENDATRRKALLGLAVLGNVGTLAYFKYKNFFLSSAYNTLDAFGLEVSTALVSVILPVGISFYTFMALAYVIDIYRRDFKPTTLPKFAVYLAFFPHLVAGPIVRPGELIPQFSRPRDPRRIDTSRAFGLIVAGLFMKVVIANYLATEIVDDVFGAPTQYSSLDVLVAIYGYSVQIFADFFGYTAIAIGVALLLGFKFPDNFNNPYTAVSIQDFWHRWHMTLSRWFRDYVYIPLGGNRGSHVRVYHNLMATMLLAGLWHGAGWTFVVWGGIHGIALVYERWLAYRRAAQGLPEPEDTLWRRAWRRFVTFQIVCFAWIFFRADSFETAGEIITQLFTAWNEEVALVSAGVLVAIAAGIGVQYVPAHTVRTLMATFSRRRLVTQGAVLGVALLAVGALGPEGVAPFIYFQF